MFLELSDNIGTLIIEIVLHMPTDLEYQPKVRIWGIFCVVWFLHPLKKSEQEHSTEMPTMNPKKNEKHLCQYVIYHFEEEALNFNM